MRQIGIYGKGGIGKSTVSSNLAAALAQQNKKVLQVGCDPKADSTRNLLGGKHSSPILELLKDREREDLSPEDFVRTGYKNIDCIEVGGPEPGIGCAGRGIVLLFDVITEQELFAFDYDVALYDVLGDVVCGGFAVPMRTGRADEIYVVVSGEPMALYAANNICKGLVRFAKRGPVRLAGLIPNLKMPELDLPFVEEFARRIGAPLLPPLAWSTEVKKAERRGRTVLADDPNASASSAFLNLAQTIWNNTQRVVPTPLDDKALDEFLREG